MALTLRRSIITAFAILDLVGGDCSADARPALFFYPAPLRLADGSIVTTVPTLATEEITTSFPKVKEMSGVVLIVNWSQLCPEQDRCDFSMIDDVLDYWGRRGKKVVLGVATVGFPFKVLANGTAHYQNATPDWVLDQVDTYEASTTAFGRIDNVNGTSARFPSYADARFVKFIADLVKQLGQYDGNQNIAEIRISAGLLTEDNPSPAGPRWLIPGYRDLDWIAYCQQMLDIFLASFQKSQLEFDLGVVALSYARGGEPEKLAADRFIDQLIQHHIFLAYDGLRSSIDVSAPYRDPRKELPRVLYYLRLAKSHGCQIGLEGAPMTANIMQDTAAIEATIDALKPDRIVLWSFEAAMLNFEREGKNLTNESALEWVNAQPNVGLLSPHLHELIRHLGFE